MPEISSVRPCRLLHVEPATERVPLILRGPEGDEHSRFWPDRAGATVYVGEGRMGDLVRALSDAIAATPATDSLMQLCGEGAHDIRERIRRPPRRRKRRPPGSLNGPFQSRPREAARSRSRPERLPRIPS